MTKAADPFTFDEAAKRTIALIGEAEAMRLFGLTSRSTLDKWRNKDDPRAPRIDQALALDIAYAAAGGGGLPFLDTFQTIVDTATRRTNREACRIKLGAGLAALQKENSELIAAAIDVLQPNATQREVRRAMVEAQDVGTRTDDFVQLLHDFSDNCGAGSQSQMAGGSQ